VDLVVAGSNPVIHPRAELIVTEKRGQAASFHGRYATARPKTRRRSQVVRQRFAKPLFVGSNPTGASSISSVFSAIRVRPASAEFSRELSEYRRNRQTQVSPIEDH
jgi:hypothetical protein